MTTTYDFNGYIQTVTVGTSGIYHITVNGASGGHGGIGYYGGGGTGGDGAIVSGDIYLQADARIQIVVGGKGVDETQYQANAGGGGGGSFVIETFDGTQTVDIYEFIAGGGGGGGYVSGNGGDGLTSAISGSAPSGGAGGGGSENGGGGGGGFSGGGGGPGRPGAPGSTSENFTGGGGAYGAGAGGFGGGGGGGGNGGGGGGGYNGGGGGYGGGFVNSGGGGGGGTSFVNAMATNVSQQGGANTGYGHVTIDLVSAFEAAPVVTSSPGTTSAYKQVPVVVDSGLTLSDSDNIDLASATVAITSGFHSGEDVLSFTANSALYGNLVGKFDSTTGVLTLTTAGGTATTAQFQAALRSVTYDDTSGTPNLGDRTISFTANDISSGSAATFKTVNVALPPTHHAPTTSASSTTLLEDATYTFKAADFPFGDTGDTPADSLSAVIVTSLPSVGTLSYNGTAITAQQAAAGFSVAAANIGKLTYEPAANGNGSGYAFFQFEVQDNGGTANGSHNTSAPANFTFNVMPVAEAPTVLFSFNGANGMWPTYGTLIADAAGNLYGTTAHGGTNDAGTVYQIAYNSTTGTYSNAPITLASFNDGNAYSNPYNTLYMDTAGNLFGSAYSGGSNGVGSIFELVYNSATGSYSNTFTTLASFTYGYPNTSLIADAAHNLYGTTSVGGDNFNGSVFKLAYDSATGTYSNTPTTLASFDLNTSGYNIFAGVIADAAGNLYGTTIGGGNTGGTVFEIAYDSATGTYGSTPITLTTFDTTRAQGSYSGLIADAAGNLYGVTYGSGANNVGMVFELVRNPTTGAFTAKTLASFSNDGKGPTGALIADDAGNLYGTTSYGGAYDKGTVFKLAYDSSAGTYSNTPITLATFDGTHGSMPYGGLHADAAGNLFGTTSYGGDNNKGTVFEVMGSGFVVPAVNAAPTAENLTQSLTVDEDSGSTLLFTLPATVSDADSGIFTLTMKVPFGTGIITGGSWNSIGLVGSDLVYEYTDNNLVVIRDLLHSVGFQPNANFNGTTSVSVAISDHADNPGETDPAGIVTITVNPINDAPVLTGDRTAEVNEGGSVAIGAMDLGYTDPDDNPAGVTFTVSEITNGKVFVANVEAASFTGTQLANGLLRFEHDGSATTTASFKVSVEDGNEDGSTPVALPFNLTVNPVNDAPIAATDTYVATEDMPLTVATGGVLTNDTDADHDTLTAIKVSEPSHGTLTLNPNGSFTYTPVANFNGTDSFTYKANDGQADSGPVTVTLNVGAVNDAPAATGVPSDVTVIGDQASFVDLSAITFSDVDSGATAITLKITASAGTLNGVSNGSVMVSGVSTPTLTLTGRAASIDAFLNGPFITYTSAIGAAGNNAATLTLTANDGGHTGSGGGGNVTLGTVNVDVLDDTAPSITIDPIASNDVVNAAEGAVTITVSGTATGAEDGRTITLALKTADGSTTLQTMTTTVSGGAWSLDLPAGATPAFPDGPYLVTADVSDAAGNPASEATRTITVDTTAPAAPTIATIIDHGTYFDVLGGAQAASTVSVSDSNGAVAAFSAIAGGSGTYDAGSGSALVDGPHMLSAAAIDAVGNGSQPAIAHVVVQTASGVHLAFSDTSFTIGDDSPLTALILDGGGLTGTGNAHGNTIHSIETSASDVNILIGDAGADLLVGGIGADHLQGGAGNDIYAVYNSGTQITDSAGLDLAYAYGVNYALAANDGADALIVVGSGLTGTGHATTATSLYSVESSASAVNILIGGAANDILLGGIGADHLQGGAGNDIYAVYSSGTQITDSAGLDLAYSYGVNYAFAADDGVEALIVVGSGLTGTGHATTATSLYSVESSASAVNTLIGGTANDTLLGGIGADNLQGGAGNDIYVVTNSATVITDTAGTADVAYTSVNYQITDTSGLEVLVVTGSGLTGTGSSGSDALYSIGSGNFLNGGSGGSDQFFFDATTTGANTVTGFQAHGVSGEGDVIALQHFSDATFSDAEANHHIFQSGADVIVADATHTIVTLQNIQLASLHANDFLIA